MKMPVPTEGTFEKCPAGNHLAVCYEVLDLGTQMVAYKDDTPKPTRQVWIGWETPHETMDDGRPFVIGRKYKLSSHEKSALRKDLESWRGKKFDESDFGNFAIEKLLGHACFLNVVHNEKGERTYANIEAVAAMPKGTQAPELTNKPVYFSLDRDEFDEDTLNGLSERMQETIRKSPEFEELSTKAGRIAVKPVDETDHNDTPF